MHLETYLSSGFDVEAEITLGVDVVGNTWSCIGESNTGLWGFAAGDY